MEELLTFLVTSLVDKPESVEITASSDDEMVTLNCRVDKEDMGKVIGKEGKTIKAIRTLLRTRAGKEGKRVFLILEESLPA